MYTLCEEDTCGLVSDLVICKHRKEYGYTGHPVSLLRIDVINEHKTQTQTPYIVVKSIMVFRNKTIS